MLDGLILLAKGVIIVKRCSDCLFGDKCRSYHVCDNYYPIDPKLAEDELFETVEQERLLYFESWLEYIDDADFCFE